MPVDEFLKPVHWHTYLELSLTPQRLHLVHGLAVLSLLTFHLLFFVPSPTSSPNAYLGWRITDNDSPITVSIAYGAGSSRESQDIVVPGDYGVYCPSLKHKKFALYLTFHPFLSFLIIEEVMKENNPLSPRLFQQALDRDRQCVFLVSCRAVALMGW